MEKSSWHPDVYVFFQQNEWIYAGIIIGQINVAASFKGQFALFVDNLNGQVANEPKQAVANADVVCWYGLPGATGIR